MRKESYLTRAGLLIPVQSGISPPL